MLRSGKPKDAETPLCIKHPVTNNFVLRDAFFDRHSPPRQHSCNKSLALLAQISSISSIQQPTLLYLYRQYSLASLTLKRFDWESNYQSNGKADTQ